MKSYSNSRFNSRGSKPFEIRDIDTLHATQLSDAIRIFPTNAGADQHNAARLETFRERERDRSMIRDLGQTEQTIYNGTSVVIHLDPRRLKF